MCTQDIVKTKTAKNFRKFHSFLYYCIAILLAVICTTLNISWLQSLGTLLADVFINIFKCLSLPLIASSIIVTFARYNSEAAMSKIWQRTLLYTLVTTIIAASIACILYLLINPTNLENVEQLNSSALNVGNGSNYFGYLAGLIPTDVFSPFLEHKVMSVLLLGILLGIAIRNIENGAARTTLTNFFHAIHEVLLIVTGWVIKIIPIGLFGFLTVTILQFKNGVEMRGLAEYLSIIVGANLIQGFVILPLWLAYNGIRPFVTMRGVLPALSLAFFSKSSAGTLPVTIETAEKKIDIDPKISRFVLPLCTTINMNGCAAFIFVTVMYLMQIHGIAITIPTMLAWIIIATIAAVGNAGVPMGCFFLSASLLASMNVPITVLALILPLYSLIDMLETALNVWSDICVAKVVDHKEKAVAAEDLNVLDHS